MSFRLKKYLLFPIFLICLFLVLNVGGADLFGTYDQRIKLTVDKDKIDSDLAWFAVTVFLTNSQGEEVFAEFDADADYLKVAFTKSDGTTELYAECELFDDSAEKAIYHVSRDGWAITSGADTDFYMYYDNDAGDNNTYIGAINTTPGAAVWDDDFEAVWHMVDATTSTIVDSTSNNNDGDKLSANNPLEVAGKVGQGQTFSSDVIDCGTSDTLNITGNITIECLANISGTVGNSRFILHRYGGAPNWLGCALKVSATDDFLAFYDGDSNWEYSTFTITDGVWLYLAIVNDDTNTVFYKNTTTSSSAQGNPTTSSGDDCWLGAENGTGENTLNDSLDEVRVSSTNRSTAWCKGTYNTLYDSLLTYGSAETLVITNVMFMFSNF